MKKLAYAEILLIVLLALWALSLAAVSLQKSSDQYDLRDYPWSLLSRWVGTVDASPDVYVRKEIVIASQVDAAVIDVAGVDMVELYINGKRVGQQDFQEFNINASFDISNLLTPGRNVIGISSTSFSKGMPAAVRAELQYSLLGRTFHVVSDESWQASSVYVYDRTRSAVWFDPAFDASHWLKAVIAGQQVASRKSINSKLSLRALREKIRPAAWWGSDASQHIELERRLHIDDVNTDDSWLGLSTKGVLRVWVNGRPLYQAQADAQAISVFSLRNYLRQGDNVIRVVALSDEAFPSIEIYGEVKGRHETVDLALSPQLWRADSALSRRALDSQRGKTLEYVASNAGDSLLLERLVLALSDFLYIALAGLVVFVGARVWLDESRAAQVQFANHLSSLIVVLMTVNLLIFLINSDGRWRIEDSVTDWVPVCSYVIAIITVLISVVTRTRPGGVRHA